MVLRADDEQGRVQFRQGTLGIVYFMVLAIRQQEVASFLLGARVDQEQALSLSNRAFSLPSEELSLGLIAQVIKQLESRKAGAIDNNR